jgi:sarcosine oxidase gamma subunit
VADTVSAPGLGPGDWLVRVFAGSTDAVQIYRLDVTVADAPAASVTITGSGCGAGPAAPLLTSTTPALGGLVTFTLANAMPGRGGSLLASPGPAVPTFLGGSCVAWLNPASFFVVTPLTTDSAGAWAATALIPASPSLAGLPFVLQAVVTPTSGPLGLGY